MSALSPWMNGERVGTWTRSRAGVHRLSCERGWLESERGRPLSLSMPFTADLQVQGRQVLNYFDNLLPTTTPSERACGAASGCPTPRS